MGKEERLAGANVILHKTCDEYYMQWQVAIKQNEELKMQVNALTIMLDEALKLAGRKNEKRPNQNTEIACPTSTEATLAEIA